LAFNACVNLRARTVKYYVRWTVNGILKYFRCGGCRRQIRISGAHTNHHHTLSSPPQGLFFVLDVRFCGREVLGMVNSRLLGLCGLLVWFGFGGDAISTLSITGTKFYDTSGQQVFFKGSLLPHRRNQNVY